MVGGGKEREREERETTENSVDNGVFGVLWRHKIVVVVFREM